MSFITQKGATGPLALQANGAFQTSTDTSLATLVGTRWDLSDGREVMLASVASGTTVAPGKIYQDAAIVAGNQNIAVTAFTAYSANGNVPAKVTVTLGTTVVANQYAGGFLVVNDNNGEGQTLRIASHPAASGSASCVITLEDAPNTAITTASEVCLISAHGKDVVITNHSALGTPVGVALCPIAAGSYGFFVTKGIVSCLGDASEVAAGVAIGVSTATDGANMELTASTNVSVTNVIGFAVQAAVSTEYRAVFMNV